MTPEQALEAIGRGMMRELLGAQSVTKRQRVARPRRRGSEPGASAGVTTDALVPPPLQQSMFEPPNAPPPTTEDLDKLLGITRIETADPPGTYRPEETETKPWLAR